MIDQEHVRAFSKLLTAILESELQLGNEIIETSSGWPHESTVIVLLKKPFIKTSDVESLQFVKISDAHYWKSEYRDKITQHILACRF